MSASYREIYCRGAFAQRELESDSQLASMARERGLPHWIGQEVPEADDLRGAVSPVAFSRTIYSTGFTIPAVDPDSLAFREDAEPRPWSDYEREAWGYPTVSPLYSPWQVLYLDVVAREQGVEIPIDVLLGPSEVLHEQLDQARWVIEHQRTLLDMTDANWRPLMKVLSAIQNVYWPQVSGWTSLVPNASGGWQDSGDTNEDPRSLLQFLGCTVGEIQSAYEFLVERGLKSEPNDERIALLRRYMPRAFHVRWRGPVRLAQDHFDAARMLYLWLGDLTDTAPGRPEASPADGRQAVRMAFYDSGIEPIAQPDSLKQTLASIELYPHGPALIGEGESERIIVDRILQALLGLNGAVDFHDLGGSGSASRVPKLIETLDKYADHAYLIVDNEGDMKRSVDQAVLDGKIHRDDVLIAEKSLEESNFTAAELVQVVHRIAAKPPEGRTPVVLALTEEQLLARQADRERRAGNNKPGLADTLLAMARDDESGGARISKPELTEGLAELLVLELRQAMADNNLEAVMQRRSIVRFVVERICPALNKPLPIS